jgi:Cu-Zn family superoxide dismutase
MECYNAIAYFNKPNVKGSVKFHECYQKDGLIVSFDLYDLEPNKTSAIHIHEYGDDSQGCKSLGGHFNPTNKQHGSIYIDINESHLGDLINQYTADRYGRFKLMYFDPRLRISGDVKYSILGRSVVIHEGQDDLGLGGNEESKITGNAGSRIACALIGISKPGPIE